jgi:hypothetical protein
MIGQYTSGASQNYLIGIRYLAIHGLRNYHKVRSISAHWGGRCKRNNNYARCAYTGAYLDSAVQLNIQASSRCCIPDNYIASPITYGATKQRGLLLG